MSSDSEESIMPAPRAREPPPQQQVPNVVMQSRDCLDGARDEAIAYKVYGVSKDGSERLILRTVTYKTMRARVAQLGAALLATNASPTPGSRAPRPPDVWVAMVHAMKPAALELQLAAYNSGATLVMLSPSLDAETISEVLSTYRVSVLAADDSYAEILRAVVNEANIAIPVYLWISEEGLRKPRRNGGPPPAAIGIIRGRESQPGSPPTHMCYRDICADAIGIALREPSAVANANAETTAAAIATANAAVARIDNDNDVAVVSFTAGSSTAISPGALRPIEISRHMLRSAVNRTWSALALEEKDTWAHVLPPGHILSMWALFSVTAAGAKHVFIDPQLVQCFNSTQLTTRRQQQQQQQQQQQPVPRDLTAGGAATESGDDALIYPHEEFAVELIRTKVTKLQLTPHMLTVIHRRVSTRRLTKLGSQLRIAIACGGIGSGQERAADVLRSSIGWPIWRSYFVSEAGGYVTLGPMAPSPSNRKQFGDIRNRFGCGRTLPGVRFHVDDPNTKLSMPNGADGVVRIGLPGYERRGQTMVIASGDVGRVRGQVLEIFMRYSDLLSCYGQPTIPSIAEGKLWTSKVFDRRVVRELVVTQVPEVTQLNVGTALAAIVCCDGGEERLSEDDVRKSAKLAVGPQPFFTVRRVLVLSEKEQDRFPRNCLGEIRRMDLPDFFESLLAARTLTEDVGSRDIENLVPVETTSVNTVVASSVPAPDASARGDEAAPPSLTAPPPGRDAAGDAAELRGADDWRTAPVSQEEMERTMQETKQRERKVMKKAIWRLLQTIGTKTTSCTFTNVSRRHVRSLSFSYRTLPLRL